MREIDELAGEFEVKAASARLSFTLENGEQILASDAAVLFIVRAD